MENVKREPEVIVTPENTTKGSLRTAEMQNKLSIRT
jgi:hypothetical protein